MSTPCFFLRCNTTASRHLLTEEDPPWQEELQCLGALLQIDAPR